MPETFFVRCPTGPRRLFMKVIQEGELPAVSSSLNLLQLACSDCRRTLRREGKDVFRVLHNFDISGYLVETHVVDYDGNVSVVGGYDSEE